MLRITKILQENLKLTVTKSDLLENHVTGNILVMTKLNS